MTRPRSSSDGSRLTLTGMNERMRGFESRLAAVESDQRKADGDHAALALADRALEHADSMTADAVSTLTKAINDPKEGLIVSLNNFKMEVANDRRVNRAYIAGAFAVLSVFWTILLLFAPAIQKALGIDAG